MTAAKKNPDSNKTTIVSSNYLTNGGNIGPTGPWALPLGPLSAPLGPPTLGFHGPSLGLPGPSLVSSSPPGLPCALGPWGPGPWAQGPQKPLTAALKTNDCSQQNQDISKQTNDSSNYQTKGGNIGPTMPWALLPWPLPGPPGPPTLGHPPGSPCAFLGPLWASRGRTI